MFVVFGLFALFLYASKPMRLVPVLFVATIVAAGALGAAVSAYFSEPLNRLIRKHPGTHQAKLALPNSVNMASAEKVAANSE